MGKKKLTAGDILKKRRQEAGFTLAQLADIAGTSQSHLCDMERNERRPTEEMIRKVAPHLDLNSDFACLIFGRVPDWIREDLVAKRFSSLTLAIGEWAEAAQAL